MAKVKRVRARSCLSWMTTSLELLDEEHFEAMVAGLEDSPLQPIVTRVTEGPLTVKTDGGVS